MGNLVAQHKNIDMFYLPQFFQASGYISNHLPNRLGFAIRELSPAWKMPFWLDDKRPEIRRKLVFNRPAVPSKNPFIFIDGPTRHLLKTPVFSADKACLRRFHISL